jgi:acyl-CoA thioesterase
MNKHDEIARITKDRYKSSFENFLGVKFNKYQDGCCEIDLVIKDQHLNIGGSVHGGIINSLCDIALSGAVTCEFVDKAESVVTMQMNVNFLRAGMPGDKLSAWGEVVKKGRTIYYVEGGVKNQDGKLIARASGDWFVKSK